MYQIDFNIYIFFISIFSIVLNTEEEWDRHPLKLKCASEIILSRKKTISFFVYVCYTFHVHAGVSLLLSFIALLLFSDKSLDELGPHHFSYNGYPVSPPDLPVSVFPELGL